VPPASESASARVNLVGRQRRGHRALAQPRRTRSVAPHEVSRSAKPDQLPFTREADTPLTSERPTDDRGSARRCPTSRALRDCRRPLFVPGHRRAWELVTASVAPGPLDHRSRPGFDCRQRTHPARSVHQLETATTYTAMGGDPIVRSTDRHPNNEADQAPDDETTTEIVEALLDDEEVIIDGFRRVSILGLEVAMLDGPHRVRTLTPERERPRRRR